MERCAYVFRHARISLHEREAGHLDNAAHIFFQTVFIREWINASNKSTITGGFIGTIKYNEVGAYDTAKIR